MPRLVSIVVLLTWGLLGLNALSGICFARDGHSGLESMILPHQKASPAVDDSGYEPNDGAVLSKERVHGPCVDVPLEQVSGTQLMSGKSYSRDVAKAQACAAPLTPVLISVVPPSSASDRVFAGPVGEMSLVQSVRSTILRI